MIQAVTFDSLPTKVLIGDRMYPISYGYRTMMAIEIEMFGMNNDEQKILNALNLFYQKDIPSSRDSAITYMLWFHRCGRSTGENGEGEKRMSRRGYCFEQDAPLIYAAFRQQYHINLKETPNKSLHWWEFAAMLESLDENTKMAKVMYWRTCDLNGMSKEQKRFIKRMRVLYALRDSESNMDNRTKLAKRNTDMKAYVRKRMEECRK